MMSALETNFGQTPSQTVGPYFAYGLTGTQYGYGFEQLFDHAVALPHAKGEHIVLEGRVFDADGQAIADALIEVSQVDADGKPAARTERPLAEAQRTGFRGFGRVGTGTDPQAAFRFHTVKPGAQAPGEAPHIDLIVLMRGLLVHAFTRVYFSDEAAANAGDAVLQQVPAERRDTLIAQRSEQGGRVGLPLRYPDAGAERDGVLRRLSASAWTAVRGARSGTQKRQGPLIQRAFVRRDAPSQ